MKAFLLKVDIFLVKKMKRFRGLCHPFNQINRDKTVASHLQLDSEGGQRRGMKKDKGVAVPNPNTPEEDISDSSLPPVRFSTRNASSKYDFVKVPGLVPQKTQGKKKINSSSFFLNQVPSLIFFVYFSIVFSGEGVVG